MHLLLINLSADKPYSKSAMHIITTNRSQKSICCGCVASTGKLPRNTVFPAAPSWMRGSLSITQGSAFYYCCTDYLGFSPRKRCLGVEWCALIDLISTAQPGEYSFFVHGEEESCRKVKMNQQSVILGQTLEPAAQEKETHLPLVTHS